MTDNIIAPIMIEITHHNAKNLFDLDFDNFEKELDSLPGVTLVDSMCFQGRLLIGIKADCESINCITLVKRFKNFFKYRWKIEDASIRATLDNKLHILDYKKQP